jgi:hypothetical protein
MPVTTQLDMTRLAVTGAGMRWARQLTSQVADPP